MSLFRDLMVVNGGYDIRSVIVSSGSTRVSSGRVRTAIVSGGTMAVNGAATVKTAIVSGGTMNVSSAATVKTAIVSGGTMNLYNRANIDSTFVAGGGVVAMHVGAALANVTIGSNGYLYVTSLARWEPQNATVQSSGRLRVSSGGTALAVTSMTGAVITVSSGGYIEYA